MATYTAVPIYDNSMTGESYLSGYSVEGLGTFATQDEAANAIVQQMVQDKYKEDLNLNDGNKDFYVDPFNPDAQGRMSDLIESRYDFIKEKSDPLESALFKYSSYDNPELYNSYISEAIPKVQQGLQQERGLMDRTLAATGSSFSDQESVLRDKLTSLQSQESITQAANQIRTRLKDREQQIAFGSAPAATNMQGGI